MNEVVRTLILVSACAFSYGIFWLWVRKRTPSRVLTWIRFLLIVASVLAMFDFNRPWTHPLCLGMATGVLLPAGLNYQSKGSSCA